MKTVISPIGEKPTALAPMTADEARACVDAIHARVEGIRAIALDLYEREGWKALGYTSWRACVVAEFDQSKSHLYRQLAAALIEREISPIGEIGQIPESQLRPLAKLDSPGKRREAWEEAKAEAPNGTPTASGVAEAVERRQPPKAIPAPEANGHAGKSTVNGVPAADPPDVAKARANGRIAPGVVVEVSEPEPDPEPVPASVTDPAEPTDEEWLGSLPARAKLGPGLRKKFDADALDYRRMESARKTFAYHAAREIKSRGVYAYRVTRFLKTDHPKHWLVCPPPDSGGCGGSGQVLLVGQCPKCSGKGYWVK